MFNDDRKLIERMAPALKRVLLIDPSAAGSRMLADLMRSLTHCQVWVAPTAGTAMDLLKGVDPQIIFIAHAVRGGVAGIEFTRRLRRSEAVSRQAPVIMILAQPTAAAVLGARDAGVHDNTLQHVLEVLVIRALLGSTLGTGLVPVVGLAGLSPCLAHRRALQLRRL